MFTNVIRARWRETAEPYHSRGPLAPAAQEEPANARDAPVRSRTLYIAGIARDTTQDEMLKTLNHYGVVARYHDHIETKGLFFATFYDQRHADKALRSLHDAPMHASGARGAGTLFVTYARSRDDAQALELQQEDKVFVHSGPGVINKHELRHLVEGWGIAVDAIYEPKGKEYKFIKCYDVRDAERLVRDKDNTPWRKGTLRFNPATIPPARGRSREVSRSPSPPPLRRSGRRVRSPSPLQVHVPMDPAPSRDPARDAPLPTTAALLELLVRQQQQIMQLQAQQAQPLWPSYFPRH